MDVYQNAYLPEGAREVNAVITVTSSADLARAAEAVENDAAEIILVDCSGSMAPSGKIGAARDATAAAVDAIRDGTAFAVIAGTSEARVVFPRRGGMAAADARTRNLAKKAVARLDADGGTSIGKWLSLAYKLFTSHPAGLRHAIMLTDGQSSEQLDDVLSLCAGVFSCDCRGVGTDWNVEQLRKISTALLGTVDIVADPGGAHRRLHGDDALVYEQTGRRCGVAGTDTQERGHPVRETGRADHRGPHRTACYGR